jgi:aryl-alcohol dehydrogenase-like predicted oxidoreductase
MNIIGIGTAQFGTKYGVSSSKKISRFDIKKIIKYADKFKKSKYIDTAAEYNNSEHILGCYLSKNHSFNIVTKSIIIQEEIINLKSIKKFKKSFFLSLKNLNQKKIYSLLIHNSNDLFKKNSELLYKEIKNLKKEKLIKKIGVSVYNKKEIDMILSNYDFDIMQIPCNILDQRLIHNGILDRLYSKKIEMHARSIFLQGLLLMDIKKIPKYFQPILKKLTLFHQRIKEHNITPLQGALSFVANLKKFKSLIVGFNNFNEYEEAVNCNFLKLPFKTVDLFYKDEKYIDPRSWKNL